MKFNDIKQFTSIGHYEITVSVADVKASIERYVKDYELQLNPDFQRGHVWNEQQQRAYVEYLLKGGTSSRLLFFNSPNWMRRKPVRNAPFVCVDGLQRITAICKFLSNELQIFGHYYNEFENEINMLNSLRFNINNLQTQREVLQWYLEMNTGGTIHKSEEIEKVKELLREEEQCHQSN